MSKYFKFITVIIAISLVVVLNVYHLTQPVNAQNLTGNQTSNQTTRIDLLPPSVLEEEEDLTESLEGQ
jgi:hypothetical protein